MELKTFTDDDNVRNMITFGKLSKDESLVLLRCMGNGMKDISVQLDFGSIYNRGELKIHFKSITKE